jgi:hypothetical protein
MPLGKSLGNELVLAKMLGFSENPELGISLSASEGIDDGF